VSSDRASAAAGLVRAARADSSIFTDLIFGYESAPFQVAWHRAWNEVAAHVVLWSPIEHGKTQQATGWALHRLGRDPRNARILWVGSSQGAAKKSTNVIKTLIEEPPKALAAVFPGLRPKRGTGEKWTETAFRVAGCTATEKDNSVEVAGVGSNILGGRFTDIVLDDVCTFETTYTVEQREKTIKWALSTVLGRLLPGGRVLVLGNAWYSDDLMHALAGRGFTVIRDEAYREDEDGRIIPGSILWPAQWPLERLGEFPDSEGGKRRELGTIEAQRQLRCKPYNSGQGKFDERWFDRALEAGAGLSLLLPSEHYDGRFGPAYMGLDCGADKKEGHDRWGFVAFAEHAQTHKRTILDSREERLTGPAGLAVLRDWWRRYSAVPMVENNGVQEWLRQFAGEAGIPTRPFTTGKNKADPAFGVASLGVELEQGLWIMPSGDERSRQMMHRLRTQCLAFAPGQHTGDLLMAWWFAREAARTGNPESASTPAKPQSPVDYSARRADYTGARLGGRLFGR
jgi:hypothetical protein